MSKQQNCSFTCPHVDNPPRSTRRLLRIACINVSVVCVFLSLAGSGCRHAAPSAQGPPGQPPGSPSADSALVQPASPVPPGQSLPGLPGAAPTQTEPKPSSATVNEIREHLQREPANVAVRIRLAALLSLQGNDSEAEDVLRTALQRGQRSAEIYHALGILYLHNEQYAPAAEAFSAEVSLHPKDFQAHLKLATAYAYLSKADDSVHEYQIATAINPAEPDPYLGLAYMNNSSERYPYAVKYLNEYIKRSPQPGPGYGLLSRVYLNMKLYDQAVTAGKKASAQMPDNAAIWYTLGQAYSYRPGDQYLNDAAHAFEQAVRLIPRWGRAHYELGHIYARLHRTQDAISQYRETVLYEPSRGSNHYQLGQLLMQQGQTAEGKQELEKAQKLVALNQRESQLEEKIAAMPTNPQFLFQLGQLYKEMGNYPQAEVWLKNTLKIAPNYPKGQEELTEVQRLSNAAH